MRIIWLIVTLAVVDPQLGQVLKRAQQIRDLQVSEAEEIKIGAGVSERVRVRYGVVQDQAVHKYVTLVGTVLVEQSARPNLAFTVVVLDTDGVNAFAAPGGFIHVTRGALGLLNDEAELAGVLAHEIVHVTEKHTIKAIQKNKAVQMGASETLSNSPALLAQAIDKSTELVLAGFGRAEELEADERGVALASKVGYAPAALGGFLARLAERNKASTEKQGLFASHPEMKERLDRLTKQAAKLTGSATLADRYRSVIKYEAKPIADVPQVVEGTAGLTGGAKSEEKKDDVKKDEPKRRGFGLGSLMRPSGGEKRSAEVTGSGASRGVDTERNAKGGSNPNLVAVNLTPADIAAFRKEGGLK